MLCIGVISSRRHVVSRGLSKQKFSTTWQPSCCWLLLGFERIEGVIGCIWMCHRNMPKICWAFVGHLLGFWFIFLEKLLAMRLEASMALFMLFINKVNYGSSVLQSDDIHFYLEMRYLRFKSRKWWIRYKIKLFIIWSFYLKTPHNSSHQSTSIGFSEWDSS